jgi:hypothetical protein
MTQFCRNPWCARKVFRDGLCIACYRAEHNEAINSKETKGDPRYGKAVKAGDV